MQCRFCWQHQRGKLFQYLNSWKNKIGEVFSFSLRITICNLSKILNYWFTSKDIFKYTTQLQKIKQYLAERFLLSNDRSVIISLFWFSDINGPIKFVFSSSSLTEMNYFLRHHQKNFLNPPKIKLCYILNDPFSLQ